MISIGVDTSCYTTSLVAMENNKVLYENRRILKVKNGAIGLRQSEAFFQHVMNLPEMYEKMLNTIDVDKISNIIVSDRPRNILGSYMPVFSAGIQFSKIVSDTLSIPLLKLSHQENHIYATIYGSMYESSKDLNNFTAVHISGGTSEVLRVNYKNNTLTTLIIGKTLDISFGKLVDRIGTYMGLDFPCGEELDKLSKSFNKIHKLKISFKDLNYNISGVENKLKKIYDEEKSISNIGMSLFVYISEVLIKQFTKLNEEEKLIFPIVMSGGISANSVVRDILKKHYIKNIIFSEIKYATDHGIGNGYYGNLVINNQT